MCDVINFSVEKPLGLEHCKKEKKENLNSKLQKLKSQQGHWMSKMTLAMLKHLNSIDMYAIVTLNIKYFIESLQSY